MAGGLGILEEWARFVNRLGPVRWLSMDGIARTNVAWRRRGTTLEVRPYGRRVAVQVPAGIEALLIEAVPGRGSDGDPCWSWSAGGEERPVLPGEPVELRCAGELTLTCRHPRPLDPSLVPSMGGSMWPLTRRFLTEGRDRLLPRIARARS
jgi:hypothetical protein